MYNSIEYGDAYSKTSGRLRRQYYRDEPTLNAAGVIIDFLANNNDSASCKFKQQVTGETGKGGKRDVKIIVPLKYLSNFWRTLVMSLINCEIILQLKGSKICILVVGTGTNSNPSFQINDMKIYVPVVTL